VNMGFLAEIVRETQTSVARPGYLVEEEVRAGLVPRPSLKSAIERAGPGGALVVEYKRVSPGSDDPLLPVRSVEEFVRLTRPGDVAGYSCIATEPRFHGSPHDVAELTARTDLPVLFKDFVVDPRQLEAATRSGASAILLIARLETEGLLTTPLAELASAAHARELEVLLEFHDKSELRRIGNVAADMYGVNVRDLDTLRMEPATAGATIRAAAGLRPLLGLSGVAGAADALRFWELGVDGILVGSGVARSPDPGAFLQTLHRSSGGIAR
jgi:indole-3-glycerol phosphate synthase